jgi:hypothetical protein
MRRLSLVVFVLSMSLILTGLAFAANPHFVGTPTCNVVDEQLCCSGKIAGLGTAPSRVTVTAPFSCTNRGGHQPPGQASGQSGLITPRGGQITFTNVCTTQAGCPDQMTPTFGDATITVFQDGTPVFTGTVPVE